MATTTAMAGGRAGFARRHLEEVGRTLRRLSVRELARVLEILEGAYRQRRQVFIAGNGGSAATASHMANDLVKTIGAGFRAIALTDNVPLITAWANDVGYEEIFAGQLRVLAHPGDVLILISGSGNSANLLRAAEAAKAMELVVIGFLGRDGGRLKGLVDAAVVVPGREYGPIEDAHVVLDHLIAAYFTDWLKHV
ncbi:MAG: SIS domain-containing protein [Candidatus Omnitrophica bacterium]|nr:SIS domain-containing protein [Candidatus Omnitrophota bacterium]